MKGSIVTSGVVVVLAALVAGCPRATETKPAADSPGTLRPQPTAVAAAEMRVTSAAFSAGGTIPKKFTGDGENVSPPLAWIGAPPTAKEFAVICDDPDAPRGPFTHWVIWGIPATITKLPGNVAKTATVPALGNAKQGKNSADKIGYFGPAPPPGKPHHYSFTVYALDSAPDVKLDAGAAELRAAMVGHIVGDGGLTGTYGR